MVAAADRLRLNQKPRPCLSNMGNSKNNTSEGNTSQKICFERSAICDGGEPSTWSQMTSGTQQFFSKTADTLTPWDNKKPAPPRTITGSNSIFTHNKPKDKESSGVAPASWWSTDKSDSSPKSVNEFLSQPRPR